MVTGIKNNTAVANVEATITRGRPKGDPLVLTIEKVRREICRDPSLTEMEIIDFLNFCQAEQMDPFRKEIYLVKIPNQPAYYVIAIQTFFKMAESNAAYKGYEAGIVAKIKDAPPIFREGELIYDGETLAGGWAKVWRADRDKPFYSAVNLREYIKHTRDGRVTRFWDDQPAGMIRKIALSKAFREAFPNRFSMAVTDAEYETVADKQLEEFTLPEPFMKDNEVEWRKVYARLKEMGLGHDEACQLLNIKSIKEDWIEKSQSIGDFIDAVAEALTKRGRLESTSREVEKQVNQSTGEIIETKTDVPSETGTQTESDRFFDKMESANTHIPASNIPISKVDTQWVVSTINALRKKGVETVTSNKLADRFLINYHVSAPLEGLPMKQVLAMLTPEQTDDFCKWLNDQEK